MLPRLSLEPEKLISQRRLTRSARVLLFLQSALHITYFFFSGIFILCLPWLWIWENNYLLYLYPKLRPLIANSFFKGAVLGLGIVNIIMGIREIRNLRSALRRHRRQ